jgi:hypothetical protein
VARAPITNFCFGPEIVCVFERRPKNNGYYGVDSGGITMPHDPFLGAPLFDPYVIPNEKAEKTAVTERRRYFERQDVGKDRSLISVLGFDVFSSNDHISTPL